jgi:hypothetical protein
MDGLNSQAEVESAAAPPSSDPAADQSADSVIRYCKGRRA